MEREELARRYREAQFAAMAQTAEMQAREQHIEKNTQQEQASTETTTRTLAQIMRLQPYKDIGPGMTENDRLRRWAGLK